MKYPKWRPSIFRFATRFFSQYREILREQGSEAVEGMGLVCGLDGDRVREIVDRKDVAGAALALVHAAEGDDALKHSVLEVVKSQVGLLRHGNVHVYLEDGLLVNALCRSTSAARLGKVSPPFDYFVVMVPEGFGFKDVKLRPFFIGFDKFETFTAVRVEIGEPDSNIRFTATMDDFIHVLAGGALPESKTIQPQAWADAKTLRVHIRLAAALCLYVAAEKGCLKKGLPDGITQSDVDVKSHSFSVRQSRSFCFRPNLGSKVDRASCVVSGHPRFLWDDRFHRDEDGGIRVTWVRGHTRGNPPIDPYTLEPPDRKAG